MPQDDKGQLAPVAEALGLPYLDSIPDSAFSAGFVTALPISWVRAQGVLPVLLDGVPTLLMSDPAAIEARQMAALAVGVPLETALAPSRVIAAAIERCYSLFGGGVHGTGMAGEAGASADDGGTETRGPSSPGLPPLPGDEGGVTVSDLLDSDDSAPVTRLVNSILLDAVRSRASDIHFEPFPDRISLRFRIDGILHSRPSPPKRLEAQLVSRLKIMAGMDIAEKRLPQDGVATASVGERTIDIRVSTVPVADGERVVLRLLNRSDTLLPMTSLGMDATVLDEFRALLRSPNGMIAVSGPTGSGKTTTLYSALGELDSSRRNVMTIEDPIEYRLPAIGQIQVKPKIGLTFANGLRHILRQDPDVVLVGETRDPETAEIAVRASLTGHLVLTTLHTNDAPSAVMRLVDMGVKPYLLASCLRGVLAQRLVRTLCPRCKELVDFDTAADGLDLPAEWATRVEEAEFFRPVGCESCHDGYIGRTGIFELMACTPSLRAAIRAGYESAQDIREAASPMRPLSEDALERALEGVTDLSEVAGALLA